MKEFNKLFLNFKSVKTKKTETQLKKERIMKNGDELYKNYYDELAENEKKKFNYKQFELDDIISTKSDKLKLPKWVKASEKIFHEILSIITEAKNNGLKANVDGEEITLDKAESLLKDISSKKMNGHEFKEKYKYIVEDVTKILNKQPLTTNEESMIKNLSLLEETIKPMIKKQMTNQILQTCLNQKVKNLLNKEEINKEKV